MRNQMTSAETSEAISSTRPKWSGRNRKRVARRAMAVAVGGVAASLYVSMSTFAEAATTYTLKASDGFGTSSFDLSGTNGTNVPGGWSPTINPANDGGVDAFVVNSGGALVLRSPSAGNATFMGGSLQIGNGTTDATALYLKGPGGTVVTVGTLLLDGGNVVVSNQPGATETLAGNITLVSGSTSGLYDNLNNQTAPNLNVLIISSAINGSGNLSVNNNSVTTGDTGSLVELTGANTYTGSTTLYSGTLDLLNQLALQNSTLSMSGGTLVFDSSVAANAFTIGGLAGSGNIALQNNAGTPLAIALTFGGNNGNTSYSGVLSGNGSLTKNGSGISTLSGANTFAGGTTISAGTLQVANATALGANAGNVSVVSGAVLDLDGTTMTATNALTLNGTGISSNGALINSSATAATYAGLVTLGSSSTIDANTGNITLSNVGTITGSGFALTLTGAGNGSIASIIGTGTGTLTKSGGGAWTLSRANTYSGTTTVNAGTLNVTGSTSTGAVQVNGGAALTGNGTIGGAVTLAAGNTTATQGTLTVGPVATTPLTLSSSLTLGGTSGNSSNLTFGLSGSNTTNELVIGGTLTIGAGGGAVTLVNQGLSANTTYNLATFLDAGSTTGGLSFSNGNGTTVDGFTTAAALFGASSNTLTVTVNPAGNDTLTVTTGSVSPAPTAAYWTGAVGASWNSVSGVTANFATTNTGGTSVANYPASTTDVYFAASVNGAAAGNLTNTLGMNFDIKGLFFTAQDGSSNTIGAVSISGGNTLQIEGDGITNANTAGVTLGMTTLIPNVSQTWTNSSGAGNLTVSSAITGTATTGNTTTLTFANNSSNLMTLNGIISNGAGNGTLALTVNGTGNGTVVLTNTNDSFTGGTTISAGTLQENASGALGVGTGGHLGSVVLAGGTLVLNVGQNFNVSNNITLTGNSSISNVGTGQVNLIGTFNGGNNTLNVIGDAQQFFFNQTGGAGTLSTVNITAGLADEAAGTNQLPFNGATVNVTAGAGFGTFGAATYTSNINLNGGNATNGQGALQSTGGGQSTFTGNLTLATGTTSGIGTTTTGAAIALNGNITGSGNMTWLSSRGNYLVLGGSNSGFSGTFSDAGTDNVFFNSATAGSANANYLFNTGSGNVAFGGTGNVALSLGSLAGNSTTAQLGNNVNGTTVTYNVGGLGATTTFAGKIVNTITGGTTGGTTAVTLAGGNLTLTGANTYSGRTLVSIGTLALAPTSGTNNISSSPAIVAGSGGIFDVTGVSATGGFALSSLGNSTHGTGQVLGGSGAVNGNVTVGSASIISAGTSAALGTGTTAVGTLNNTGTETWAANGEFSAKITAATGAPGTANDYLKMSGLTVTAPGTTGSAAFYVAPVAALTGLTLGSQYTWDLADVSSASAALYNNGATGVIAQNQNLLGSTNSAPFVLDTSNFSAALSSGGNAGISSSQFTLELVGDGGSGDFLQLGYTAAPEPGTVLLVLAGAVPMLTGRRRRRKVVPPNDCSARMK